MKALFPVLFICVAALGAPVVADEDRRNVYVGRHLGSGGQNNDHGPFIASFLQIRFNSLPNELEKTAALKSYMNARKVLYEEDAGQTPAEMIGKFDIDKTTLMILSGVFFRVQSQAYSNVHLGIPSRDFRLDFTDTNIQVRADFPAGAQFIELLFLYAMIKEAVRQGLSWKEVISPMHTRAKELATNDIPSKANQLRTIREDLERLTP